MFSVIIPTYKSDKTLLDTVKSCNHNSIKEIIVINDNGSSLSSFLEWKLKKLGAVIINNRKNRGVTFSRNRGFFLATQEVVIFLDSDDQLISSQVDNAINIIVANDDVDFFLFSTETNGKINSKDKCQILGCGFDLISMANRGERLVSVRRTISGKPFIGYFRGHELSGLLHSSILNSSKLIWSDVVLRHYDDNVINSLSSQRFSKERAKLIFLGHLFVSKLAFRHMKIVFSIKYLTKALYYYVSKFRAG